MTSTQPEPILDRGAQAERTRLSWNRTALAIAVNAALLAHAGDGSVLRYALALLMLAAALACFVFADRRYRAINAAVRSGRSVSVIANVRVLAFLTLVPMVIALVSVLV